jgi:hypothetical protein
MGVAGTGVAGLIGWGGWLLWQNTPAPLVEGEVVGRDFEPAHWEDYQRAETGYRPATRTVCSGGFGTTPQTCRTESYMESYTYYVWDTRWVEDDWDIIVYGCSLDRQGDEHCREENKDANEDEYDRCQVGMTWRRETDCQLL